MKKEKTERAKLVLKNDQCKPLRETVFETIRDAIINGVLKPGEHLMEIQLADELEVSRTPVRESIRKLELEGLVKMVPRKGAFVTPISFKDLREMMQIRRSLEILAAELAAENASEEEIEQLRLSNAAFERCALSNDSQGIVDNDVIFHEMIYKAAHNDRLFRLIHGLREQNLWVRMEYVQTIEDKTHLGGQHNLILENIVKRDKEKAAYYAGEHIIHAEQDMFAVLLTKDKYKDQRE